MSDASYDPTEDGTESDDSDVGGGALSANLTASPLGVLPGQNAGDPTVDSPVAALQAATARLKAQRTGLTQNQQIAALLMGYAKPATNGGWQANVVNAAQNLQDQTAAKAKTDQATQDLITKYDLASAHYQAQNQAAAANTAQRAAAAAAKTAAGPTLNPEQVYRLGMAQQYFPTLSKADILSRNLLYDPKVNAATLAWKAATPMAAAGDLTPAPAPPTLNDFMVKARLANPNTTDAALQAYYTQKYGGM